MSSRAIQRAPEPFGESALVFPKEHPQSEEVADALTRSRVAETLVDLYDAWRRLQAARVAAAAERAREAERLDVRAEYVLRTLEAARNVRLDVGGDGEAALTKDDGLGAFQREAEEELRKARLLLEDRSTGEESLFESELARVRAEIRSRVEAVLVGYRPRLKARVQPVGREHSLVHVERPGDDDAVLLQYVLTGKLFTRYDAFFDDSVDDLTLGPPRFYAEEGLTQNRFETIDEEDAIVVEPEREFVPLKGVIMFRIPGHDFPRFRIVNRGPMSEVEARTEGGDYQHLMPRAAAELLSAYLLRLRVAGKLDVELSVV